MVVSQIQPVSLSVHSSVSRCIAHIPSIIQCIEHNSMYCTYSLHNSIQAMTHSGRIVAWWGLLGIDYGSHQSRVMFFPTCSIDSETVMKDN